MACGHCVSCEDPCVDKERTEMARLYSERVPLEKCEFPAVPEWEDMDPEGVEATLSRIVPADA